MSTHGVRFIAAAAGCTTAEWFSFGDIRPLFEDDGEAKKAFEFMDSYARQHGKVPGAKTIQEETNIKLPAEPGEMAWLVKKLRDRRVRKQLALTGEQLQGLLKHDDPGAALKLMYESSSKLIAEMHSPSVADFKQASSILWPWLLEKWSGAKPCVPFPWPTLEAMTGGVYGGEMISTVGRPEKGKSWQQLHIALHIWEVTRRPIVFASQEMMIRKVMERLAALYTKVAMDLMKDGIAGANTKKVRAKLKTNLLELEASDMPPFIVTDGNLSSTAQDVVTLCRRFQPAACFVDGAYLLRAPDGKFFKKHEAIDFNCESLKRDVATALDIPIFTSWQFSREGAKLKKGEEIGLEHIAGSDAIGQLSSIVLGMLDDPDETRSDVENIARRKVRVLKGRDGERGHFYTQWDFDRMDFREVLTGQSEGEPELYGM